jgi:hypothetical protein
MKQLTKELKFFSPIAS